MLTQMAIRAAITLATNKKVRNAVISIVLTAFALFYMGFVFIGAIIGQAYAIGLPDYYYPMPNNTYISSGFEYARQNPTNPDDKTDVHDHLAIDFPAPEGTEVYAAYYGRVLSIGYGSSTGLALTIQHPDNVITRYYHLSEVLVNQGDDVWYNQPVALSGNTGNSTGPHLHFELCIDGTNIDPTSLLKQRPAEDEEVEISSGIFERPVW